MLDLKNNITSKWGVDQYCGTMGPPATWVNGSPYDVHIQVHAASYTTYLPHSTPEKTAEDSQISEFLPPMLEIWTEFLAPAFRLAQIHPLQIFWLFGG